MVAASGHYHRHCFRCFTCNQPLDSTRWLRCSRFSSHTNFEGLQACFFITEQYVSACAMGLITRSSVGSATKDKGEGEINISNDMHTNSYLKELQHFIKDSKVYLDFYLNPQLEAPILWRGKRDNPPDPREGGGEMLPKMQWHGSKLFWLDEPRILFMIHH